MQKLFLFPGHFAGFLASLIMVIPGEVKDAVNHQEQDHLLFVQAEPARFSLSGFNRDHDVSEEVGMEGWKFTFSHREGNDIGGFVPPEIVAIQPSNLTIIDERDANFGIRQGQVGQYCSSRPSYSS